MTASKVAKYKLCFKRSSIMEKGTHERQHWRNVKLNDIPSEVAKSSLHPLDKC